MKKITLLAFLLSLTTILMAVDVTWTGAEGPIWNNSNNWDTGQVPGPDDVVIIPEGTPACKILHSSVTVQNIKNHGKLVLHNGRISTAKFENYDTISVEGIIGSGTYNSIYAREGGSKEFLNAGIIINPYGINGLEIMNFKVFANGGNIDSRFFRVVADKFYNEENAHIGATTIKIECKEGKNYGSMISSPDSKYHKFSITANNFENKGNLKSESYICECNIELNIKNKLINHGSGFIGPEYPDIKVNVKINAKQVLNNGYIKGKEKGKYNTDFGGIVIIAADSIWMFSDSASITGAEILLIHDYLLIFFMDEAEDIYTDWDIDCFGVANSIVDLTFDNAEGAFYSQNGHIAFHSDIIYEPFEGIDYICNPDPEVYPSDTTFTWGYISSSSLFDSAGATGDFQVLTQNQSTGYKSFNYSITSKENWITPLSGTTALYEPFQFDSLIIEYTIPLNADTLSDTVMQVLFVPGVFYDTVYSYIQSYPGFTTHIEEENNKEILNSLNLYPNPSSQYMNININGEFNFPVKVDFYNLQGQIIKTCEISFPSSKHTLNIEELENGIYLVWISDGSKKYSGKVVKIE